MPRAILAYHLPREAVEHRLAITGDRWYAVADSTANWLRSAIKHGHPYETADRALEAAQQFLLDAIAGRGLSLDDGC